MKINFHKKCETFFMNFTAFIYTNKYIALAMILLFTLSLASQLGKLEIDTRDEGFFHEDDPTLVAYNDFKERFGQDEIFIIALQHQQGIDKEFLNTLYKLHHELKESVPYIDDITSLVNGRIVRGEEDTLYVEDLLKVPPQTNKEVIRIKKLIDHFPLYENFLISRDRTTVSIIIKPLAIKEPQSDNLLEGFDQEEVPLENDADRYLSNLESMEITKAIEEVITKYQSSDLKIYFTGTPAVVAALQTGIEHDLSIIMPLSLLLIIFFLTLLYRRVSGVVYPLLIVILSLFGTFGFMALTGIPVTLVSQILPSFLLIVGIADTVHILTIFYRNYNRCGDKKQAIIDAVGFAGLPVLMTSITTACGLLSFAWADMATVAQLGYVGPAGVLLAFIYTMVLLPVFIAIFPVKQQIVPTEKVNSLVDSMFHWIAKITTRHSLVVTMIFGFIITIALYSALTVRFSHNISTWFPENSPIRIATNFLDSVNGGSVMLEALIDSGQENGFHNPDYLHRLDQAIATISELKVSGIQAGKVWALPDVLKETNRALNADQESAYTIPQNQELVAQELILFESSGSDDLEDFTDSSYRTARLSIMAPFEDAILYANYTSTIQEYLTQQFPNSSVVLTGKIQLFSEIVTNAVTTLAKSYTIAIVLITLLMIVMVGRIRIGVMSMAANVTPIICILGLMGMNNINLDLSTMLVGSLVLGIVVDDTIHFLHHFRRAFETSADVEQAVRETLITTGRALFITSMVLCGGFFIYTVGALANNVRFGIISGAAIIFALIADFFLVPALLSIAYGRKQTDGGNLT
ncbi:MAG: efflux RND transporter permease subunit [Desulfobulbaceae bacterium]|nr:efflux RND transporter permease subunit [Desulfobulbaceae bacterium]